MYAKIEKPKENKSRAVANSVVQEKRNGKQGFEFVDNRADDIVQRALNKTATTRSCMSENVLQLDAYVHPVIQLKPTHYNRQTKWTERFNTKCIASEGKNRYHGYNSQHSTGWLKRCLNKYLADEFETIKHHYVKGTTFKAYKNEEGWSNFNCAEFVALDVALSKGANPANLVFKTVDKSNKVKHACGQCSMWLTKGKVKNDFIPYLS